MDVQDSDYVIICTKGITSISNTLKKLWILSDLYSSYIQTIYKYKEESINNIFITYVEPLLDDINHPELVEEWKINIYAVAYDKQLDSKVNKPSV